MHKLYVPAAEPEDHNPADLQTTSDVVPDAEEQAAEADAAVPTIPAEIPEQLVLPRLADRSAVIAPADAIGELTHYSVQSDM